MVVMKIRCTEAVSRAILSLFSAIETIAQGYKPEDLIFEVAPEGKTGGGRGGYWAKLPTLADGTFDMAEVSRTVEENLRSVGAHTVNGIIYQDIVDVTLNGEKATEPVLRKNRMMAAGSSQRAVQQLFHSGLIDRGPIEV